MYENDENRDRKRRRRYPFDIFGLDDDFINEIFNNDDIRRMAEEMMKMFTNAQPGKSIVHGYKIHIGPDGKPRIEDFGNKPKQSPTGKAVISEEREPLTDIIEEDEDIAITVEIPGVEKDDINLDIARDNLEIKVDTPNRKYHKNLALPCDIIPKTTKATYKNGILDIVMKRKEKRKPGEGYHVDIE